MTNTEIDRALALAIGYRECDVRSFEKGSPIHVFRPKTYEELNDVLRGFEKFDHQAPTVIYPLIEHYKIYVGYSEPRRKYYAIKGGFYIHKSLATAIALCVIELEKNK